MLTVGMLLEEDKKRQEIQ